MIYVAGIQIVNELYCFVLLTFSSILTFCSIKTSVLERIHQEPEKKVKTVIIQAAGQIALAEADNWPELFRLLEETVGVEGLTEMREVITISLIILKILIILVDLYLHIPNIPTSLLL